MSVKNQQTGKPCVSDQRTDRSGAVLVKIAKRMNDQNLAESAMNLLFSMDRKAPLDKTASFPTDTPEDTLLSRIYFEGQREKFAADMAAKIDSRLRTFEILHGVEADVSMRPLEKKASGEQKCFELLPQCKVACVNDLVQAGRDFSSGYRGLASHERVTFAENFVKVAFDMGADVPEEIKLYAGVDVVPRPDMAEQILLRKVAMDRMGEDSSGYAVLATQLRQCDVNSFSREELRKLASAISFADEACDLEGGKLGKTIPDAWHSVMRVKTAEEVMAEAKCAGDRARTAEEVASSMGKADVIGRFGPGVLEELEDADGNIDTSRLAELIELFGGAKQDIDTEPEPERGRYA